MYIPSQFVSLSIESESYGVWAESYHKGCKSALLVKIPSTTIKSILQGATVEIIVGETTSQVTNISIALMVEDAPANPFHAVITCRDQREIHGIINLLKHGKFSLTLYDETNTPVVSGEGFIHPKEGMTTKRFSQESRFSTVDSLQTANIVLDSFSHSIDSRHKPKPRYSTVIERHQLNLTKLIPMLIVQVSEFGTMVRKIDSIEEGLTQEQQLASCLEILFGSNVYHSPKVIKGKHKRELTDVLAFDDRCSYLIESKALGINISGYRMSEAKKVSKMIKHTRKALNQLRGCITNIRKGCEIVSGIAEQFELNNQLMIHGIVVLSEFIESDKWVPIIDRMISISRSRRVCLHVMDLSEFIKTVRLSTSPTIDFGACLVQRFENMVKYRTLNIKGFDSSLPWI